MFGFLTLEKDTDKAIKDIYRQHFCGLCSSLSKEYGMSARIFTNYDATLIYLLTTSQVDKKKMKSVKVRCPLYFSKKDVFLIPELVRFSSAISVVLIYEKMLDDNYDEKKQYPSVLKKLIKRKYTKAQKILEQLDFSTSLLGKFMERQRELEKMDGLSILDLCEPTALMMKNIFGFTAQLTNPKNKSNLEKIGYAVGQMIYVIDSIVDYSEDIKFDKFNALFACYPEIGKAADSNKMPYYLPDEIEKISLNCLKEIENNLKDTKFYNFKELIEDILITSLSDKFTKIFSNPVEKEELKCSSSLISEFPLYASCIPFIPEKAFASNGANSTSGCFGSLFLLAILFFAFRVMFKGCSGGALCGDSKPDKVQVDQGCGGNKTYYKHSDGRYREHQDSSCC